MRSGFVRANTGLIVFATFLTGQDFPKVDFATEVAPLFRQNCVSCHGPATQQAGLRLDRRSSAMKPLSRRIVAGSSENSFVYHRLTGAEYGQQMPPTGALRPEQIAIVKTWIDQGANWPDSLANEADLPSASPRAEAMVNALHLNDLSLFMKYAIEDPSCLNSRGPEGSTPFMYAALYADAATLSTLLKMGADPNKRNDVKATALMWVARDLEKTRLLVEHGADVNAKSDDMRTPLMIASRRVGSAPIVKLLLDHKANVNPNAKPATESSPLMEALISGDVTIVEMLMKHGADAKSTGDVGFALAVASKCRKCLDLLASKQKDTSVYTAALQDTAVFGDVKSIQLMLAHGADVNATDPLGRTPLMYAAVSETKPLAVVKILVKNGANVNAKDTHKNSGDSDSTVLDIAKRNGESEIVKFLLASGAQASPDVVPISMPRHDNSQRSAIQDSLPLLQRADASFTAKSGCFSCHNNSMAAIAVGAARAHGFRIDEQTAAAQVKQNVLSLEKFRQMLYQGFSVPVGDYVGDFVLGYMLVGLNAEHYQADLNTDAAGFYLLSRQSPDGQWAYPKADTRPPICLNYMTQTALALRALQLYAPGMAKTAAQRAVRLGSGWLATAKSANNQDRIWRLIGLAWAGLDRPAIEQAMRELRATQRMNGGWSDFPSTESNSFVTGESLVALRLGGMAASDPILQKGVQFLLKSQQADGSWHVKTRALGFQPYFDSGFPHGHDQWLSAAGTSWAALALTLTLSDDKPVSASLDRR